jgi:hypothetical protein
MKQNEARELVNDIIKNKENALTGVGTATLEKKSKPLSFYILISTLGIVTVGDATNTYPKPTIDMQKLIDGASHHSGIGQKK